MIETTKFSKTLSKRLNGSYIKNKKQLLNRLEHVKSSLKNKTWKTLDPSFKLHAMQGFKNKTVFEVHLLNNTILIFSVEKEGVPVLLEVTDHSDKKIY